MISNETPSFGGKIIKTIEDDDEIEYFSEDSNAEEFQPSKRKRKENKDFDSEFKFVDSVEEYNKDTWNDLAKYIKRRSTLKTDDRIKRARLNLEKQVETVEKVPEQEKDSYVELSDDELVKDNVRTKNKKSKKKETSTSSDEIFFEEGGTYEKDANFYQMNLSRPLLKAISAMNFVTPTPIQAATIPVALLGRDICGCAATGTGKTAAYMLPTLERLLYRPVDGPAVTRVLVLVPTRELGVQVYQVTKQLSQFLNIEIGLAVGGLDVKIQENVLRKNPDIIIATPGRLIDHLYSTPNFSLDAVEVLILDEADRILDEYFAEQMKEIIKQCSRTHQTLLFSATMTDAVEDLASVSLKNPVKIFVDSNKQVAFNLRQEFVRIRANKEADREPILAALICRTFHSHCMVFVQTKKQARRLHILLGLLGIKTSELHGNLTQPQRLEALRQFKDEEVDVLVATDVAARGLDIPGVQTVINFVMPATVEHYIHRVGRTARAGRVGVSVSLAGERERKVVKEIIKKAKQSVKSRIIPTEIIEKYRLKLEKLEPEIEKILEEEQEARLLAKTENKINMMEKVLKGEQKVQRPWFQTHQERKKEKENLAISSENETQVTGKKRKKERKRSSRKEQRESAEDRIRTEIDKVALLQAKLAKKKQKLKKLRSYNDADFAKSQNKKRKISNFTGDICDVSTKKAKMLRYEVKRNAKSKSTAKNKSTQKGKVFGQFKGKKGKNKSKF